MFLRVLVPAYLGCPGYRAIEQGRYWCPSQATADFHWWYMCSCASLNSTLFRLKIQCGKYPHPAGLLVDDLQIWNPAENWNLHIPSNHL